MGGGSCAATLGGGVVLMLVTWGVGCGEPQGTLSIVVHAQISEAHLIVLRYLRYLHHLVDQLGHKVSCPSRAVLVTSFSLKEIGMTSHLHDGWHWLNPKELEGLMNSVRINQINSIQVNLIQISK